MLGLPKRRTKRSIQSMLSDSGVPLGVVTANTTDSAPLSALMAPRRRAVSASASSQPMRTQPGSGSPLGRVRRMGCSTRCGLCTSSGAALPFMHMAWPVGCAVSGRTDTSMSPRTSLSVPQRERQSVQ